MKDIIFKGVGTAIATPFDEYNNINYEELKKLLEIQINNGVNAIIACGTTGEGSTLTKDEKIEVIKYCVDEVKGRIPVIAGVGSNNTIEVINNIKFAEKTGVDGFLIVTPYYNKTTQEGLIRHYTLIASETRLPIILYNVPGRTGVDISPETYLELSKIKNIVATKEASGNLSKIAKIKSLCGDSLNIYSGNDDQILPVLSLGGIGVISVLSNIMPQYTSNMINYYFNNEIEKATKMQIDAIPLINSLFEEVNPIPVKAAMRIAGFDFGEPRLPLVDCSDKLKNKIRNKMKALGTFSKNVK